MAFEEEQARLRGMRDKLTSEVKTIKINIHNKDLLLKNRRLLPGERKIILNEREDWQIKLTEILLELGEKDKKLKEHQQEGQHDKNSPRGNPNIRRGRSPERRLPRLCKQLYEGWKENWRQTENKKIYDVWEKLSKHF